MYIVCIKTRVFSKSSESFNEEDSFYITEDGEKAELYARYKSLNPMVTKTLVAEVKHEYEDGTDIYGRNDETASS